MATEASDAALASYCYKRGQFGKAIKGYWRDLLRERLAYYLMSGGNKRLSRGHGFRLVARCQNHPQPALGQLTYHFQANAAAGSSDQCDAASKVHLVTPLSWFLVLIARKQSFDDNATKARPVRLD